MGQNNPFAETLFTIYCHSDSAMSSPQNDSNTFHRGMQTERKLVNISQTSSGQICHNQGKLNLYIDIKGCQKIQNLNTGLKKSLKHMKGQHKNIPNVGLCNYSTTYFTQFPLVFFALRQDAHTFYTLKRKLKFTCSVGFFKEQFQTKNFENSMPVWQ